MAIPGDLAIQISLLDLLASKSDGKLHCNDAYRELALRFPQLTKNEREDPYQNSLSHWANRVQFAVLHLRRQGLILHHTVAGGRGIWAISESGRQSVAETTQAVAETLKGLGL